MQHERVMAQLGVKNEHFLEQTQENIKFSGVDR